MAIESTSIKIAMPVFNELKAIQTKLIEERKRHITFTEVVQDYSLRIMKKKTIEERLNDNDHDATRYIVSRSRR